MAPQYDTTLLNMMYTGNSYGNSNTQRYIGTGINIATMALFAGLSARGTSSASSAGASGGGEPAPPKITDSTVNDINVKENAANDRISALQSEINSVSADSIASIEKPQIIVAEEAYNTAKTNLQTGLKNYNADVNKYNQCQTAMTNFIGSLNDVSCLVNNKTITVKKPEQSDLDNLATASWYVNHMGNKPTAENNEEQAKINSNWHQLQQACQAADRNLETYITNRDNAKNLLSKHGATKDNFVEITDTIGDKAELNPNITNCPSSIVKNYITDYNAKLKAYNDLNIGTNQTDASNYKAKLQAQQSLNSKYIKINADGTRAVNTEKINEDNQLLAQARNKTNQITAKINDLNAELKQAKDSDAAAKASNKKDGNWFTRIFTKKSKQYKDGGSAKSKDDFRQETKNYKQNAQTARANAQQLVIDIARLQSERDKILDKVGAATTASAST